LQAVRRKKIARTVQACLTRLVPVGTSLERARVVLGAPQTAAMLCGRLPGAQLTFDDDLTIVFPAYTPRHVGTQTYPDGKMLLLTLALPADDDLVELWLRLFFDAAAQLSHVSLEWFTPV
jgi:hypothetical protein